MCHKSDLQCIFIIASDLLPGTLTKYIGGLLLFFKNRTKNYKIILDHFHIPFFHLLHTQYF